MALTLEDFREVLGRVNDGNVVMVRDERGDVTGIKKANYGFFKKEKIRTGAAENRQLREALVNAISNSPEGRRAGAAFITHVRMQLGLPDGRLSDRPLDRRVIKDVLDGLALAVEPGGVIIDECLRFRDVGIFDFTLTIDVRDSVSPGYGRRSAPAFRDEAAMLSALGLGPQEGFNGFSRAKLERFLKHNVERIRLLAFDRLYLSELDYRQAREKNLPTFSRSPLAAMRSPAYQVAILKSAITALMAAYARHEDVVTAGRAYIAAEPPPAPQEAVETMTPTVDRIAGLFDLVFPTDGDSVYDATQHAALARAAKTVFANACYASVAAQNAADPVARRDAALAALRTNDPEAKRLLDLPIALLDGLSAGERMVVSARLRTAALAALRTAVGDGRAAARQVMNAVADAVQAFLRDADPVKITTAFIRKVNADAVLNIPSDKLPTLAVELQATLDALPAFAAVRKLVVANLVRGLAPDAGLGENPACRELAAAVGAKVREILEGPQKREEAFLEIGRCPDAVYQLDKPLRVTDAQGNQLPCNDLAARIAGKIAFVKKILGRAHGREFADLMRSNGDPELFVFHGDAKDFADEAKWPACDREFLRNLDAFCARYTIADINDTLTYFKAGLATGDTDDALYLMGRDKAFNMEDANNDGALLLNQLPLGGVSLVLSFATADPAAKVKGDYRNLYETYIAAINPRLPAKVRHGAFDAAAIQQRLLAMNDQLDEAEDEGMTLFGSFANLSKRELIGLLDDFGLKVKDLATTDGVAKLMVLARAKEIAGEMSTGLAAWVTRMTGLDVKAMSPAEMPRAMAALEALAAKPEDKRQDPLAAFAPANRQVVDFLEGRVKAGEFALEPDALRDVMKALRALSTGGAKEAACTIRGVRVVLSPGRDGILRATVAEGAGKAYPIVTNRSAADLLGVLETKVANRPDEYGALAGEILPVLENGVPKGMTESRARELCTKVLVAKLQVPSVVFAATDMTALVTAARGTLAGTYTKAHVPTEPSTAYNAADIVAVQKAYVDASEAERARVTMPADLAARTAEQRANEPPPVETVHACLAELVMNLDTSAYDRDAGQPAGTRLKNVLKAWRPELAFILRDEASVTAAVATLPAEVRAGAAAILNALRGADPENLTRMAAVEAQIKAFVAATMDTMQARITVLFDGPAQGPAPDGAAWKKSLEEMTNVNGLDPSSPNGRFVLEVLKHYFAEAMETEKRAMLAAYLRNARADFTTGQQAGELMKGAGPIFQKMLQGLPIESFAPETQKALKDMKSRLSPIPDAIVRAQLLDLIRSSNGAVLSIEVRKSIGCATVGQALLCHIVTKAHPYTGEDVVIKLRRPNVQTAALREHAVMRAIALRTGGAGMADTFEGQFSAILKELDFTLEAENVDVARVHYDRPKDASGAGVKDIRSMGRFTAAPATMGALILEKVQGDTLDGYMEKTGQVLKTFRDRFERKVADRPDGKEIHTVFEGRAVGDVGIVRHALKHEYEDLVKERKALEHLVKVWTNEVLFGSGFFHGDLHAGNVMVQLDVGQGFARSSEMTFIDFGNVTRLSPDERKKITKLFVVAGYSFNNTNPGAEFLEALKGLLDEASQATLANERAALEAEINDIMRMGQCDKLAAKVIAALSAVQRHRVPLPESLGSFLQSMARLKGAMTQLDHLMEQCERSMQTIAFGPMAIADLDLDRFEGKLPLVTELKEYLARAGRRRDNVNVDDEDAVEVDPFYAVIQAFDRVTEVTDPAKADVLEFRGVRYANLFGEDGRSTALARAFADTFRHVDFDSMQTNGKIGALEGIARMDEYCDGLEKLLAEPPSPENDAKIVRAKSDIRQTIALICREIYNQTQVEIPVHHERDSFEAVMAACVTDNMDAVRAMYDYDTQLCFGYGSTMIDPKILRQRARANRAARRANLALPDNERLGDLRVAQLAEIARDFRFPGGPAGIDDLTPELLKETLEVNMRVLRRRLGYAEGERIAPGEFKYLATYFRTIRQVRDDRGKFMRGMAIAAALGTLLANMFSDGFDVLSLYELKEDRDLPMVRAVKALSPDALSNLGLSPEAAEFARLLRAA